MIELTDQQIVEAYRTHGSVHKAGMVLGVSHSRIHRCVVRLGLARSNPKFSESDRQRLLLEYDGHAAAGTLDDLAQDMGRTKQFICRKARDLGLTNAKRPTCEGAKIKIGEAARLRHASQPHPRGFSGKTHTHAARSVMSKASLAGWEAQRETASGNMSPEARQRASDRMSALAAQRPPENAYSRTKAGRRPDLGGAFFRSSWEANYARYLNWLQAKGEIVGWEYEPTTFWFEAIKRGVRSYKPDFLVHERTGSYFVEVKGWMDSKSITKLKRMKKYHPTVEVRLVDQKQYQAIARSVSRLIPGWEGAR